MVELEIFTKALGLALPFQITSVEFREGATKRELHIRVAYEKGTIFEYEGIEYSIYDHQERTWRHLNFFEHECYLHFRIPRIKTKDGKVVLAEVPWSEPYSRFTLLFEKEIVRLCQGGMSASGVGKHLGIGSKKVFAVIKRRVNQALASQTLSPVESMSVDETSSKKGHNYLTIMSDLVEKKVIGIGEGKDANAFVSAKEEASKRLTAPWEVKVINMDMSPSFIHAAKKCFPETDIVFDRFHLMLNLNKALDTIRRNEQKNHEELKTTKYLWLRNNQDLKLDKQAKIDILATTFPTMGMAYRLKESFRQVLNNAQYDRSLEWIEAWVDEALKSNIPEIIKFVNMIQNHWFGIVTYFKNLSNNGFAERVNLKIQEIKRLAKGYRNMDNFKCMIYFHLGKLDLHTH